MLLYGCGYPYIGMHHTHLHLSQTIYKYSNTHIFKKIFQIYHYYYEY